MKYKKFKKKIVIEKNLKKKIKNNETENK